MFGTASYGYNVLDNLTSVKVAGGSLARDHAYVYDASNRLVNIKNTVGGATVVGLGYDPQGNLANKNGQTYSFTYGNRLRAVPGKETYLYDGQGRRVESRTTNYSVWQYSQSGQVMYSHDARNNRKTNYIYLGGSLVALRDQPMSGGTTVTVKYQHTDALGTPIAVTDAAKAIVETFEYEPYGQLVNSTLKDGPGFTGHVQDAATALTYMQQRYYDPQVGLFLSVDPVTAYSNPVGMFNRYKYAANNPYRFVDPDGRQEKVRREREEKVTGSNKPGNSVAKAMIATTASEGGGRWSGGGGASGGRGASGSWGNGGATGDWGPRLPTDEEERIEPIFPEAELPLLKGLKFATLGLFAIRMGARAELEVSAHALRRLSAEEGKVVANEIARHISQNGAPAAGATIQQTIMVGGREYSFRAFGMTNGSTRLSTVVEGRFGRDVAAPKP